MMGMVSLTRRGNAIHYSVASNPDQVLSLRPGMAVRLSTENLGGDLTDSIRNQDYKKRTALRLLNIKGELIVEKVREDLDVSANIYNNK